MEIENMFSNCNSTYGVKKQLDRILTNMGASRCGYMMADALSHFERNGWEHAADATRKAIERTEELKKTLLSGQGEKGI